MANARLAPGSYVISAAFRGYKAATVPVEVRGGQLMVNFTLAPEQAVSLELLSDG